MTNVRIRFCEEDIEQLFEEAITSHRTVFVDQRPFYDRLGSYVANKAGNAGQFLRDKAVEKMFSFMF